ncbi:MAG: acetylxylan esterase [Kiritimatiellae bacterium]|nr:acetylxylan esterase [Kiritimatiellia bacterium]MDD5521965.1 acetylxylan esterase [Kiritimatiellia bacterium]
MKLNNCRLASLFCLIAITATTIADNGKPVQIPWDISVLSKTPQTYPVSGIETNGVKSLFFEGLPWKGKPTRVFAWVGMPDHKPGEKVPAMVLVHGGGGTAFATWVKLWNSRGYAAIAMDTCGCVPVGKYGAWQRHENGGPAGWGGFKQIDDPIEDQWTYHAVADAILAHSLLRSMPDVDADRIGLTGISWGGYLTCIIAGVDERFRFAAPVYGCGFLGDNSAWLGEFKKMGEEKAAKWLRYWDPSQYLPLAKMFFLWLNGTNDFAYPLDSYQKSYRCFAGKRTLCIRVRMPHGHGAAGENPEEIHVFADNILKSDVPLACITKQGFDDGKAWVTFDSKRPIMKSELNFTKDTGIWQKRKWETIPADLDLAQHKVSITVPAGTTVFYLNLIDENKLAVSSEHVEIK